MGWLVSLGEWWAEERVRRRRSQLERMTGIVMLPVDEPSSTERLLEECARADHLAGRHGGFVTTAKIRAILGGDHA